jgi:hypothetical protein
MSWDVGTGTARYSQRPGGLISAVSALSSLWRRRFSHTLQRQAKPLGSESLKQATRITFSDLPRPGRSTLLPHAIPHLFHLNPEGTSIMTRNVIYGTGERASQ